MEQLGWLQIGQHQLQQDVTHGLAFVLVDGRDNELDFADLISVFLLDGYGIFHVGLLPERYETMIGSPPLSRGETQEGGTFGGAALLPCSTLGQLVPRSVGAVLKVPLGFLQSTDVKDLIELCHHTPDVRGRKPAVFHSVDDIATAGVVAPRLGKQGRQSGIMRHVGFLLDKSFGSTTLMSLARHKTAILGMTLPRGAAARRDKRPACPTADRGRGVACPTCGAGVVRSFSCRRNHSAPAAWLPALWLGAAAIQLLIGCNSSHIPRTKNGSLAGLLTELFSNIFS